MGTSKGYIPPTTVHWTQAKRAVSGYIKNVDENKFVSFLFVLQNVS